MTILWLSIIVGLTIIEVVTVNLVTIWFVASGIAALIASYFTDSFLIQLGIFVILGIFLLLTTKYNYSCLSNRVMKRL